MEAADIAGRRLAIFDFDGTLANTVPSIITTARTVLARHGLTEDEMGDLTRLVGPPFPQAYSLVYGFSEEEAVQITAEYRAIYRNIGPSAWPLFDGIADLLARLRAAGHLTAVASSKQMRMVERALADNEVTGLFDRALGKTSDAEGDKVAVIRRVVRELGLTEADAVMVGDRHHDVEAAAACGIPCVGVTYGGTGTVEELMGAGACVCVGSVEELGRVLLG